MHVRRPMRSVFGLLSLLLVAACSSSSSSDASPAPPPSETTSIAIGIDAEDFASQGLPLASLEIVTRIDGVEKHTTVDAYPQSPNPFPYELSVSPPTTKPDAELEIVVNLIGSDGLDETPPAPPVLTRLAKTHFTPGKQQLAYLFLETRCNHAQFAGGSLPNGPTCDETANTCIGGACALADLPPLPDYDADWKQSPPSDCGTGAPELTLGQGESTFASLADGDLVTLEQGPQCGHHFWVALSMKNLAQSETVTTLRATQPGTGITVPATAYPYRWSDAPGGACELDGLRFQLDTSTPSSPSSVSRSMCRSTSSTRRDTPRARRAT